MFMTTVSRTAALFLCVLAFGPVHHEIYGFKKKHEKDENSAAARSFTSCNCCFSSTSTRRTAAALSWAAWFCNANSRASMMASCWSAQARSCSRHLWGFFQGQWRRASVDQPSAWHEGMRKHVHDKNGLQNPMVLFFLYQGDREI